MTTLAEHLEQQRAFRRTNARRLALHSLLFAFFLLALAAACALAGEFTYLHHPSRLVLGVALAFLGPPAVVLALASFFAVEEFQTHWQRARGLRVNPFDRPCPNCAHKPMDTFLCIGHDFRLHLPSCPTHRASEEEMR